MTPRTETRRDWMLRLLKQRNQQRPKNQVKWKLILVTGRWTYFDVETSWRNGR